MKDCDGACRLWRGSDVALTCQACLLTQPIDPCQPDLFLPSERTTRLRKLRSWRASPSSSISVTTCQTGPLPG